MDDMRLAPSPSSLPRLARPGPVAALLGVLASALSLAAGHASAATVTLTVAKGGGEYTSVQAAVNAVPNNSSTLYTIQIGSGTYEEAVTIPAAKLHRSEER